MLVWHEVRRLIRWISFLRAWLLGSSEVSERRLEVLSHSHCRWVVHALMVLLVHVWLNGNHGASMNDVRILSRELKIPSHGWSINSNVLIARVLIYV